MEDFLIKWLVKFLSNPFLYLLSLIYGIVVWILKLLYKFSILPTYRPEAKVISIGNITLGGTGKTPLVEFLAGYLKGQGRRVAILIRGYGNDEQHMLKKRLAGVPVLAARDRIKSAKNAEQEFNSEVIILDDGFQHWRLKRDLDIVLVSNLNGIGNGRLIPRGILREPISALLRAGVIIFTGTDSVETASLRQYITRINPSALLADAVYETEYLYTPGGTKYQLDKLRGKKISLLSGIGSPESFKKTALDLGLNIGLDLRYPDHHQYSSRDYFKIVNLCKEKSIQIILTTEKDFMRMLSDVPLRAAEDGKAISCNKDGPETLLGVSGLELLILKVRLKIIKNEQELLKRISSLLDG